MISVDHFTKSMLFMSVLLSVLNKFTDFFVRSCRFNTFYKDSGGLLTLVVCLFILSFITGDEVLFPFDQIPSKQKRPLRVLYPI